MPARTHIRTHARQPQIHPPARRARLQMCLNITLCVGVLRRVTFYDGYVFDVTTSRYYYKYDIHNTIKPMLYRHVDVSLMGNYKNLQMNIFQAIDSRTPNPRRHK